MTDHPASAREAQVRTTRRERAQGCPATSPMGAPTGATVFPVLLQDKRQYGEHGEETHSMLELPTIRDLIEWQ